MPASAPLCRAPRPQAHTRTPRPARSELVPCLPARRIPRASRIQASKGGDGDAGVDPAAAPATPAPLTPDPLTTKSNADTPPPAKEVAAAGAPAGAASPAVASVELEFAPGFQGYRLFIFAGIVIGYLFSYLNRLTLTYAAPTMVADAALGITKADIGAMTSAFPMAYGISKFVSGMLGAAFSPRVMLAGGLVLTSFINIAFGYTTAIVWWTLLWAANGALQGVGAPACAMLLTRWFAPKERGTYWGLWNTGTNLGGFVSPILVGSLAKAYGWQWGMWVPGIMGLVIGSVLLFVLKDKPEDAGWPPVEAVAAPPAAAGKAADTAEPVSKRARLAASMGEAVRNKGVWLLALAYFFVYMLRQGCTSWLVFYLLEEKGATDAAAAAVTVSGLELGGLAGGILSGVLSDAAVRRAKETGEGFVGKRVQIVMAYTLTTLAVLAALRAVPAGAPALQWLVIGALGFSIYGPQMLIGLAGAELVSPVAVSASQGILGLVSYIGAANAGVPLAFLQQSLGWNGYFAAMAGSCVATLLLLVPLWGAKSVVQRQREEAAALGGAAPA